MQRGDFLRKYFEIFKYSIKTKINFIFDYLMSLCSFSIHVFVFSELWDYILQGKENVAGYTKTELIWYIIIGEFILYTCNRTYKFIAEQVKSGQIANMLIKPVDFIKYMIADDLSVIVKGVINAICGITLGLIFAGPINMTLVGLIFIGTSIIIAVFMGIYIQLIIGLLAFYTEENDSFWLIIQKLMLFLVFTPLEFYPSIIQKMFLLLPTTYVTYAPARIFTKFELSSSAMILESQTIALIILIIITRMLYKKGVEKINVNGG